MNSWLGAENWNGWLDVRRKELMNSWLQAENFNECLEVEKSTELAG
jgi:hypothetical protein